MSKRDKRKARQEEQKRQEAAATSKPKPAATELISKIEAELPAIQVSVSELYENAASASDTTGTTPDPSPAETEVPASDTSTPSPESLKSLSVELKAAMSAVKEAERRFDAARKGAEELRKRNEERANALAEDRGKLNAERDELKREKGSLASNRDALIQREQQLNECLMDLDLREERAKAGFIDQWDALREEHSQRLKKDELAHSARLDQERKELDQTRADVANRQRELDLVRERLEGKEQDLGRQERRLQVRDSMLDEDRKELAAQAQADARAEVESLETQLRGEEATIKALRGQCDRLHEWKAAKEAAEVERGGKSPDQLVEELKTANNRIQELHAKLRESLPQDQAEELKVLRRQLEDSQKMTATLRGELAEANGQRDRLLVQVGETESHTVVFTSLQKQNALLNNEHKRLQDEIRALMDARQSDATFEACEQMDQDADYSALPPRYHGNMELVHLASTVRQAIAAQSDPKLYYSDEDVRSFIGGLAMSRLMILQGASGTGKTSLARAFIKAVAGGMEIIEVQAGWRDRHDLLGIYNAFEHRFHERPCLKALYQAGTPKFAEKLFFIILDEMNLSPPEYYFADFNSLLESGKDEIEVHDRHIPRVPKRVVSSPNKSMVLKLPPNVWFIGTANRDETTSTIAPKTYDRSHVLELPAEHEAFTVDPSQRFDAPVKYSNLMSEIERACHEHKQKAEDFIKELNGLGPALSALGVHPSPRFRKQASRYVPVVIASGGSLGEAADYLLTYRILQPVVDRFGVSKKALEALRRDLHAAIQKLDSARASWKSISLIDNKLESLSSARDEE